jgi:hypothetical protein
MKEANLVWLASYPRSGNTFLRTIFWHCFGLRSASVYPSDLGGNHKLEDYVGHIEHDQSHRIAFPDGAMQLLKTHEYPKDDSPAIYVVRDGRDACISLWKFYNKQMPLLAVVRGQHRFGTWAAHINAWRPQERPNTLLLRYEQMVGDLPTAVKAMSAFVGLEAKSTTIPDRDAIAGVDGRWVRAKEDNSALLTSEILSEFERVNGEVSRHFGYDS